MYLTPVIKYPGLIGLVAINFGLLIWALTAHFQKRTIPDGYCKWLVASPVLAGVQAILGITLLTSYQAPGMHMFYGVLVAVGAAGQLSMSGRTALAQKYRAKPLVYAFFNLFVLLLSLRSWMAA